MPSSSKSTSSGCTSAVPFTGVTQKREIVRTMFERYRMGVRAGRRRAHGTFGLMGPDLYPDLKPVAFLLGTWEGEGEGRYPTVSPFDYRERLAFGHVGDAFLLYALESWSLEDAEPLHFERGFLRPGTSSETVQLTLAHAL